MPLDISQDVRLSHRTSFRIGGIARRFIEPRTVDELRHALQLAKARSWPVFVLGGGTNTLLSDGPQPGLVIGMRALARVEYEAAPARLVAEAGAPLSQVIRRSVHHGASGLEPFVGIPGTIGGAVYGNAGGAGVWIQRVVRSLLVVGDDLQLRWIPGVQCQWDYRSSGLGTQVIAAVELQLSPDETEQVKRRVREFFLRKLSTQPLSASSAGCVFRNPRGAACASMPSAGQLIDRAGLKGLRVGGAVVSEQHANFIVNEGGATATDVVTLIELIKTRVLETHGVALEREIVSPSPSGGWTR